MFRGIYYNICRKSLDQDSNQNVNGVRKWLFGVFVLSLTESVTFLCTIKVHFNVFTGHKVTCANFLCTTIRHNIMNACLIMWRFPLCNQNSSDLLRHGLTFSEGVLWCSAPGHFIVDPLGPVCWGVLLPSWIRPARARLRDARSDGSGKFGPFIVFLELFLRSVCGESGHIVLLGSHRHWVVLLWWGGVLGPQQGS